MSASKERASYPPDIPDDASTLTLERVYFIPAPSPSSPSSSSDISCSRVSYRAPTWFKDAIGRSRDIVDRNVGLLLIASSQGFYSLMNVVVKKLNSLDVPIPTLELVFARMLITYACCIIYMHFRGVSHIFLGPPEVRVLLVSRGFCGFFGLFGVYYSLNYLSLSDATVLTFLGPLTTAAAGAIILKEKFTIKQAIAGVFSLTGVILIARPQFLFGHVSSSPNVPMPDAGGHAADGDLGDVGQRGSPAERLGAVGIALLGVLGGTGAWLSIRAIGTRAHAMHSMVAFSAYCVIASSAGMLIKHITFIMPTKIAWVGMLIAIGILGFIAQTLMTIGLQKETASRGSMACYVQIIFATTFERVFFHNTPSSLSILGTMIILSSAIYVALLKENNSHKDEEATVALARDSEGEEAMLEEGLLSAEEPSECEHAREIKGEESRQKQG